MTDAVREGGREHAAFINELRDVVRSHAERLDSGSLLAMLYQMAGEVACAHNRAAEDVGDDPVSVDHPAFVAGVVANMMIGYARGDELLEVQPSGGPGRRH